MPPKKQTKKKNDDWDDAAAEKKLAEKLASQKLEQEKEVEWDEESDDEPAPPPPKAGRAAAFEMLMDDDSDAESDKSEPEPEAVEVKQEPAKKPQEKKAPQPKSEPKQDKKKGKKGKKAQEDEDLDALLAEFDKPAEKPEAASSKKKKGKKDDTTESSPAPVTETGKDSSADVEPKAAEVVEAGDEEGAKKKKKKKKDKKKGGADEEDETEDTPDAPEKKDDEEAEGEDGEDGADGKDKKKKKKKKDKKKADKDDDEDGKGKPKKKGHVSLIKEMLRAKQQAEEEALKKQQEDEERLEKLEKEREEAERLAKEKKDAEKERKKALIEKQKAEGTFMTAKQKEQQRIAMAKLAAAGVQMPVPGAPTDGKRVVYLDKRSLKKQQAREAKKKLEQASAEGSATATPGTSSPVPEDEKEAAESWDAEDETPPVSAKPSVEEDTLDDWEIASLDDIRTPAIPVPVVSAKTAKKESADQEDEESSSEEESESSSEESSSEESEDEDVPGRGGRETKEQLIERVKARIKKRKETAEANKSTDNLRAPVICVLGHVDTGKTKMLDTIRRTNVQDGEAGGITQQIGATEVPAEAIKERCKQVRDFIADAMKLPAFLIIDTPGHESFSNLRSRGESLCDFAILVVDIMHGLEPQTLESLKMLLKRKTPFVIALNKIDRLYGYESNPRKDVYQHLKSQPTNTQLEFKNRYEQVVVEFAEQGVNVCLSNNNKDVTDYISMVPTSAMLGDGIGNLMAYIVNMCQQYHANKLAFSEELDASVMEVKSLPGLGTTVDIILVNGRIKKNDILVLTGTDGPIVTPIRDLLTPQPLRDVRVVKSDFIHHNEVQGAQGVKVLAKDMEKVVAGLPVYVAHDEDELDVLMMEAEAQLSRALHAIKKKPEGVYVMASTLGSLEALLEFLKTQKIPYSNVSIGPVHKKDVQKASTMKEHRAEYACILAFDVKIEREAQLFADKEGVRIFQADIIYHLEDNFLKYREDLRLQARKENEHKAIFPCKLRVLPQHVFNARNPIVCGVVVDAGQLKRGTPICVPSKDGIFIGTVASVQRNHEEVPLAKKGEEICIKIENTTGEAPKLYGRHFTHEDALVSMITRDSIDVCKEFFRDDLSKEDWQLVVQLKKLLDIV